MTATELPRSLARAHIANHYLRAGIGGAVRQGADPLQLLAAAGIPAHWLDQPERLITEHQLSELIKAVWRATADEFMGMAPRACKRGVFSLMAEFALGAKTLGGMLERSARFYTAVRDDLDIGLDLAPAQSPLVFYRLHLHQQFDPDHFLQEFILLMWQRFAGWLIGQQIPVVATCFGYPAPSHAAEYRVMFIGELHHDQPRCGFYLHPRVLQLPILRSDTELQAFLRDCPGVILHRPVQDNSLQTRVRLLLQHYDLRHMPELGEISQQLLMTPRTLRRRLQDEGTSVRQIKESLRREFALRLLSNEHLSVQEVAEQSGFAEVAAFCRAFKRWTGRPPAQWRNGRRLV
ncbi:MAG: AraC family transcriptional regulator [Gammaproteobacteria bacterium HGW-Gammaproteobacteria-9]|uniref:DNA-binding domain-containing protein, AraC-type n=1 Tax=Stutzerimonas stutzeri RCH2 TaxID=644801 RepID=L0GM00_STUST|nr:MULTISPECIES: AraC family transcriptional regulator [Pseudomonadaceae]AGA86996.1 DNA-binding domain-containing protein, AraC-type [Stutzerimonas stutzeri RCH2]PKL99679.1 MAG: AraC family transcriptional regulator [Gammaproteobacteria bacterium HGW-Gammaproteobacteria-9]GCA55816.1 urease operon transcriptional activator [Pseudomonas sp. SCT]